MASFHLWHPAFVGAGPVLDAFVTLGDALELGHGSDELIADVLAVLGLVATPRWWTFDATRTHYFSSYRGHTDDWRDAWSLAWRVRVGLDARVPLPAPPVGGCFELETIDASCRDDDRIRDRSAWPCTIIADLPDDEVAAIARDRIARATGVVGALGLAFGVVPQLRVELGPRHRVWYQAGAAPAEALLDELVGLGASVRFDDTLGLLERAAPALESPR